MRPPSTALVLPDSVTVVTENGRPRWRRGVMVDVTATKRMEAELEQARWPQSFVCPCCGHTAASVFRVGSHPTFQCKACRHQTSLTAGTLFESTKLPLTLWFLAIYLISQAKTGLSALALKRLLGVSYPTAWLLQHKLMAVMSERDATYPLNGRVDIDDAYLGGELSGGKAGRGSENKVPFVAALSFDEDGHPRLSKLANFSPISASRLMDSVRM